MYCITCGHEIHSKTAIKHMEKCFNKYESQASFGSIFKTRIEGNNMFCDFYNSGNRTYCKRLRVLCPESLRSAFDVLVNRTSQRNTAENKYLLTNPWHILNIIC